MDKISKEWNDLYRRWEGGATGEEDVISRTQRRNSSYFAPLVDDMDNKFGLSGCSVLEVGPGQGTLADQMLQRGVSRYTVVDHPLMLERFSRKVDAIQVPIGEVETHEFDDRYDLFVSQNCLTEVPLGYCHFLAEKLVSRCDGVYIFDEENFLASLSTRIPGSEVYPCPWIEQERVGYRAAILWRRAAE